MTWFHWLLVGWLAFLAYMVWRLHRTPVVEDRWPQVVVISDVTGEVFPVTDEWPVLELLRTVEEIEAL